MGRCTLPLVLLITVVHDDGDDKGSSVSRHGCYRDGIDEDGGVALMECLVVVIVLAVVVVDVVASGGNISIRIAPSPFRLLRLNDSEEQLVLN